MSAIVEQTVYEIKVLVDNISGGKHIVTGDIGKLSAIRLLHSPRLYFPARFFFDLFRRVVRRCLRTVK